MPIGKKHRARLRIQGIDEPDSIVLLVRPGQLVLANTICVVGVHRCRGHKPRLLVITHHQAVYVVAGLSVPHERAGLHHFSKILGAFCVHRWIMWINALGQIDLGFGYVQEAPWPAFGALARLFRVQYVIGRRCNLVGIAWRRPQAGERAQ